MAQEVDQQAMEAEGKGYYTDVATGDIVALPEDAKTETGLKFQCYCCGEEVDGVIALVTMRESSVDRVFVMKPEHTSRVDEVKVVIVERKRK